MAGIYADGPWTHHDLSANGIRLHVTAAGDGPLVVLLHGFPQYWWAWRHQLPALADAGLRAAAVDLRGYGGSDKPPRGYDALTLAADVAGLVRALGERDAVIAGTGWGGLLAWVIARLHPEVVRRIAVIGSPHPRRLRQFLYRLDKRARPLRGSALRYQLPRYPEALLTRNNAAYIEKLLRAWSGPQWTDSLDFAAAVESYREIIQIPATAHCAMEYYRWMGRSQLRPDGWRFAHAMSRPVCAPTLQLHGECDGAIPPVAAQGSSRYVEGRYEWQLVPGVGHFVAEEAPEFVNGELVRWAKF